MLAFQTSLRPKRSTPSISSFDSEYETCPSSPDEGFDCLQYDLNPSSPYSYSTSQRVGNFESCSGYSAGDETHIQGSSATIEPVLSKLDAFNISNTNHTGGEPQLRGGPIADDQRCLTCGDRNLATPGNANQCQECNISTFTMEPDRKSSIEENEHLSRNMIRNSHSQTNLRLLTALNHNQGIPPLATQSFAGSRTSSISQPGMSASGTRCSACDLLALTDPNGPSTCPSCAPTSATSQPASGTPAEPPARRSRAGRNSKLPVRALNRLQGWLDAHQDNPYPSADIKRQLAQECGITEKQVTTWFTNARARQLNRAENLLSSSSDDEAAFESDITTPNLEDPRGFSAFPVSPQARWGSAPASSAFVASHADRQIASRRGKKKNYRRKQPATMPEAGRADGSSNLARTSNNSPTSTQETWQCTFCLRPLVPKSWRRHEETQHRPRTQWTCMLSGPRLSYSHRPGSCCAFCMIRDPSEDHFHKSHRITECAKRPIEERTFFRPDHLRQHIKNFHGSTLFDITQSRWKKAAEATSSGWTCGFCGEDLSTWDQREKHIANHFKEGKTMEEWKYDGGNATATAGVAETYEITDDQLHSHSHGHQQQHQHGSHTHSHHHHVPDPFTPPHTQQSASTATSTHFPPTPLLQSQSHLHPGTFPFTPSSLPQLSSPSSFFPSSNSATTAPLLSDIHPDPVLDMSGAADFFTWNQVSTQSLEQQVYPVITDGFEQSYLAGAQGEYDSGLGPFGFGNAEGGWGGGGQ